MPFTGRATVRGAGTLTIAGSRHNARIVLAVLGVACSDGKPYSIAVVLDASGIEGAQLAADRINADGGINGHRLELRTEHGAEKSARVSLATAERLSADNAVLAVVGHTNSASSLSASQVYNARKVVQLSPTASSPLYSQAGVYSFRMVPSDIHQGAFLVAEALRSSAHTRVAVVFVNSDYGRPLHGVVLDSMRRAGVPPVFDAPFDAIDSTAGRALLSSLMRANPEVMIWIGRSADLMPIAARLRVALPRLVIIASDGFSRRLPMDSTRRVFDAVRYVRFVDVERRDSVLQSVRTSYARTHGMEISDQTLLAYDAVTLLGAALRAVGPRREAIRHWLEDVGSAGREFTGVTGPVKFSGTRERAPGYVMVSVGR
jgi:branched-chain amino acid transport system substrate-binding protein